MKIIEYKCNICGSTFNSRAAHADKLLKAVYFTGNIKFVLKDLPAECDTHICITCLDQLKEQL